METKEATLIQRLHTSILHFYQIHSTINRPLQTIAQYSNTVSGCYLVTLLYLRASLYPGNAVSATSSAGRISVTKHFHLRWRVGIDKLCHVKNAVRISSSLSRISQDLWFVWDGGQIIIEPSLERVHFAASHVSNISW